MRALALVLSIATALAAVWFLLGTIALPPLYDAETCDAALTTEVCDLALWGGWYGYLFGGLVALGLGIAGPNRFQRAPSKTRP